MVGRVESYDVVIVGLGPAGSSLAYLLRNKGLRVVAVDLVDWDGLWGKPCGDAIGAHHFEENDIPPPSGDEVYQRVEGIDIYSPSEKHMIRVKGKGYMLNRNKLGRRLVEEAQKAGVDIRLRTRAVAPVIEAGKLAGVRVVSLDKGEHYIIKAKIVVDATGSGGALRRKLPSEWPVSEQLKPVDANIAFREIRILDYEIEEPEYIRIYLNKEIAPGGYWWFFPKGANIVNVGLGVQGGRGYPKPTVLYYEKLAKRPDIARSREILSSSGALVPTRRPANTLVWDNFIGIGDNSFTVNPVHGGGMGYAMHSAYHAAKAIEKAFETGDFSAKGLWYLNVAYMKGLGAKQASLDIFRIFLQELENADLEYGIKHRIMRAEDAYETSVTGELKADFSVLDKVVTVIKTLGRPSLLPKLVKVAEYMRRVRELYMRYPESPEGLSRWVTEVNDLYAEYKRALGVNW